MKPVGTPQIIPVTRGTSSQPSEVLRALVAEQLIIYPTETLYALGGLAVSARVCAAVRATKGRDELKALPVIAGSMQQALGLWTEVTEQARLLADRYWPGPLTLVGRARPGLPDELTAGRKTLAVRVSGETLARGLCLAAGPLVSTSANLSGSSPPLTCGDAVASVGGAAAVALDAGPGSPQPSTVVDVSTDAPHLIRAGAIEWESLLKALAS